MLTLAGDIFFLNLLDAGDCCVVWPKKKFMFNIVFDIAEEHVQH